MCAFNFELTYSLGENRGKKITVNLATILGIPQPYIYSTLQKLNKS